MKYLISYISLIGIFLLFTSSNTIQEYCYRSLVIDFEYNNLELKQDQIKKLYEWIDYMSCDACVDSFYVEISCISKEGEEQSLCQQRELYVFSLINNYTKGGDFLRIFMDPTLYTLPKDEKRSSYLTIQIERWYMDGYIKIIHDK